MARILYELLGTDDRRFSPYCWRARLALAHKGLEAEIVPVGFTDKDKIAFSGQTRVPVLVDGEKTVSDSWDIACHLEDRYPQAPSLFGGETGRALARFIGCWVENAVFPPLFGLLVGDIFAHVLDRDRDYFRKTREAFMGRTIEEAAAERDAQLEPFRAALVPARMTLGKQAYLAGPRPAYADYILFGAFQWARGVSPLQIIEPDDPLHGWRERMLDLHDGLARRVPAYD